MATPTRPQRPSRVLSPEARRVTSSAPSRFVMEISKETLKAIRLRAAVRGFPNQKAYVLSLLEEDGVEIQEPEG